MLKDLLKLIEKYGYISRDKFARELGLRPELVDDGLAQLERMGYLTKEETGDDCADFCSSCPFAKSCSKEIITTYKMSEK